MAGEVYDHLMAVVVLIVIFAAAVFVVPTVSYVNLRYMEQQQMRNIALSAFKTMLFDKGYPSNWGSMSGVSLFSEDDVRRFGLALVSDPTLYVLDSNKVQRLANNPTGNISQQRAQDLLGLSGYGFSLIIRPLFNVERSVSIDRPNDQTATINFRVNVSRYDGQPVPNAIVLATIIYAVDTPATSFSQVRVTTDSLGHCEGDQTVNVSGGQKITDVIVIFRVTVADLATMVVSAEDTRHPNNIAKINVVGDNIVLTNPDAMVGPHAARWVLNILMYNFETSMNLLNGSRSNEFKLTYGQGFGVWSREFEGLGASDPAILILTFDAVDQGRTVLLLVGPYAMWSPTGPIEFTSGSSRGGETVSVQRNVIISGMAYLAELQLWKTP
jgi:hypothetical protein